MAVPLSSRSIVFDCLLTNRLAYLQIGHLGEIAAGAGKATD
jgi:hypothetical protein